MQRPALAVSAALLAALLGPLACGGAPPPAPVAATPPPPPAPKPVAADTPSPLDLAPAPEPVDIVGTLRWKDPLVTFATAAQSAAMPPQLLDAAARAAVEGVVGEAMKTMVNAHEFAQLVALDAPVDAVMTLDPSPKKRDVVAAISVGLMSLDGAKKAGENMAPLFEIAPSIWKIGGRNLSEGVCAIAAAVGPAPARLICGHKDKDLVALGPYLARTLPTSPSPSADLHVELRLTPVDARYGDLLRQLLGQAPILARSQVAIGEPNFDRAVVEGATGLADELGALTTDLDKITFDLSSSSTDGVTGQGAIVLRNKNSWLAGSLLERPERAGPPPAIYWRAPKDSDTAFWGRGADSARYSPILRVLRTLADGALAKEKIGSAADRKALTDLIQLPFGKDTSTVSARGHADPPKPTGKPTSQQVFAGVSDALLGWTLIGIDEGSAASAKLLKDIVGVYNRATLMAPIKKELGSDAKSLPTVRTVPAPAQLGAGAIDVEIKASGLESPLPHAPLANGKRETLSFVAHVLLMADGKQTWLAFGANRDELVRHLLQVKIGAPDAGTLGARAGLEPLKAGKNMAGGFLTLTPLLASARSSIDWFGVVSNQSLPTEAAKIMRLLNSLPNRGETPMFFTTQSSATAPMQSSFAFNLPRGAVDDFTALAIGALRLKSELH